MGLVNCAGIAPAVKTVGKDGAHPLAIFTKTITVNLMGSFNMIRLAAAPLPPGWRVLWHHVLTAELAEDLAAVDRVTFLDASVRGRRRR